MSVELNGRITGEGSPLILLHGLFGSADNLGAVARGLEDGWQIHALDLRNHGGSPHADTMDYPSMAEDVLAYMDRQGMDKAAVLGHSMGGKAVMLLALTRPELLRRVVVADIAPVSYGHTQKMFIDAMRGVDLDSVERRSDAEAQLAEAGVERALQSFFPQSLDLPGKRWRLNLDTLEREMPQIIGWPEDASGRFDGPTLFLSGGASDYVRPEHREPIKQMFPAARFAKIPQAGHWLHAEKPREFEAALRVFLDADLPQDPA